MLYQNRLGAVFSVIYYTLARAVLLSVGGVLGPVLRRTSGVSVACKHMSIRLTRVCMFGNLCDMDSNVMERLADRSTDHNAIEFKYCKSFVVFACCSTYWLIFSRGVRYSNSSRHVSFLVVQLLSDVGGECQ